MTYCISLRRIAALKYQILVPMGGDFIKVGGCVVTEIGRQRLGVDGG